jgi:hypothetical protein
VQDNVNIFEEDNNQIIMTMNPLNNKLITLPSYIFFFHCTIFRLHLNRSFYRIKAAVDGMKTDTKT